jgi:hypothetical protein
MIANAQPAGGHQQEIARGKQGECADKRDSEAMAFQRQCMCRMLPFSSMIPIDVEIG